MRLTTGTATLAVAGLAALVTGCSSSSPSAAPAAPAHVVKPVVQQAAAKPLSARQQLAAAQRKSLEAHTAMVRIRETVVQVARRRKRCAFLPAAVRRDSDC